MDTKKLRQKILDLAIHGKLVPQDPNDEPASVLLERIKAEKEQLIKEGKIKRQKKSASSDTSHYGNIPNGWSEVPMSELFILNPKNKLTDESLCGFIPMSLVEDGFSGRHCFETRIWEQVKKGFSQFQNGDIGIAKISPCFENLKSVIFEKLPNGNGAGTTELTILRSLGVYSKFYLYLFKSGWYISEGTKYFKGVVGQQRVNKEIFTDLVVPVPPINEQKRISEEIDRYFALVDALEQNEYDLKDSIQKAKAKILDLALSGKLTSDISHYGKNEETFSGAALGDVCKLCDGEKIAGKDYTNLDVKYLRGTKSGDMLHSGRFVPAGSLMILVDGENSGEVFTTPIDGYQGSTFKILDFNAKYCKEFILLLIQSNRKSLRENKVGSAIPHLNKKMFKEIVVPPFSYNEQCEIAQTVKDYFCVLDSIVG